MENSIIFYNTVEELNEYLLPIDSLISGTKANGKSKFSLCIGWQMEHWDRTFLQNGHLLISYNYPVLNHLIYSRYQFLFFIQSKHTDF